MKASTPSSKASPKLAGLYCRASWHLRRNPRAIALYDMALQLTDGGKTTLRLSRRQVAKYFGWGISSVDDAFNECERQGFFVKMSIGKGGRAGQPDFANTYTVKLHKQVADEGKYSCLTCPPMSTAQPTRPVMGTGVSGNENRGVPISGQDPSGNGNLVYDVGSPYKSEERVSEQSPALSLATHKAKGDGQQNLKLAESLAKDLAEIAYQQDLTFDSKRKVGLAKLLADGYTPEEIKSAFRLYVSKLSTDDAFERKHATRVFVETADQLVEAERRQQARRKREDAGYDAAVRKAKLEAEQRLAEARKQEENEFDPELFDPELDDLPTPSFPVAA